jgi:P27 family predicted phage terminase small subunit
MALNLANGGKNWTKKEIHDRLNSELQPVTDGIVAPAFLTKKQKDEFNRIARQLETLGIMGETDCDMLARYIVAQSLYEQAVKDLRKLTKDRPKETDYDDKGHYYADLDLHYTMIDSATKRQDRYFKQATTAAAKLGLTISDRCRLVVPVKNEAPKENRFSKFRKVAGNE